VAHGLAHLHPHGVDRLRELTELVLRDRRDFMGQVPLGDVLQDRHRLPESRRDHPRDEQAHRDGEDHHDGGHEDEVAHQGAEAGL